MGRDHFLRALHDDAFSVEVRIQKPQTLEHALTVAMELEALGVGSEGQRRRKETSTGGGVRGWTRSRKTSQNGNVYQIASMSAAVPEPSVDMNALARAIRQLTSSDEPGTTPTYSGRGGRSGRTGNNRWPAEDLSDSEDEDDHAC